MSRHHRERIGRKSAGGPGQHFSTCALQWSHPSAGSSVRSKKNYPPCHPSWCWSPPDPEPAQTCLDPSSTRLPRAEEDSDRPRLDSHPPPPVPAEEQG